MLASLLGKYPPVATDAEVNICYIQDSSLNKIRLEWNLNPCVICAALPCQVGTGQ